MTVYIVTSGEYSDYRIDAVFSDEEQAWKYAMLNDYSQVETYEMDSVEIEGEQKQEWIFLTYNFERDDLNNAGVQPWEENDNVLVGRYACLFDFCIPKNITNFKEYVKYRENGFSALFLKIAQDRFAKYAYEQGMSRKELVAKSIADCNVYVEQEEERNRKRPYVRYTTSSDVPSVTDGDGLFNANSAASIRTNDILRILIKEGEQLPSYGDLIGIFMQEKKKVEEEHEQDELH